MKLLVIKMWMLVIFSCFFCFSYSQENNIHKKMSIYGKWKCVDSDFAGYQKFSIEKASQLTHTILNVEAHKVYYSGINFVGVCSFHHFMEKKNLQDDDWSGTSFATRYSKDELSQIVEFDPVDNKNKIANSCYNNCSQFYLKQDTLINICGGYTLFFLRYYENSKEYTGEGQATKHLLLKENTTELKINFEFYTDADELFVEDQEGKLLFDTKMISTNNERSITIPIHHVKDIILKVKCQQPNSRWKLSLQY